MILPSLNNVVYPDYNRSIINFISSLLSVYDVDSHHTRLNDINIEKLKEKSNILLIIFDGLGYEFLKKIHQKEKLFIMNYLQTSLTTVSPSSTPSAITSIMTGETPLEHGNLGWTLFFKEFGQYIQLLPMSDYIDNKSLNIQKYAPMDIIKLNNIFKKIKKRHPDILLYQMIPHLLFYSYYNYHLTYPAERISYHSIRSFFKKTIKVTKKKTKNKKLVIAYCPEPDLLFHEEGTYTENTLLLMKKLDHYCQELAEKLKGTNTSIFITSDHGLIDIDKTYYMNEEPEIYESLIMPTFPEKRFFSCFVKKHRIEVFEKAVKKFEKDFLILNREDFLSSGLLGTGKPSYKIDDFIGDYVFLAIAHAQKYTFFDQIGKKEFEVRASHSGLTSEEMLVPLIHIEV